MTPADQAVSEESLVKVWKEADGLKKKGEPLPPALPAVCVQAGFMIFIYGGARQALEVVAGRYSRDPAFWVQVRRLLVEARRP